ncbi:MAG: serine/threonine-protein kinase, partial [Nannocystaceae bacterium]
MIADQPKQRASLGTGSGGPEENIPDKVGRFTVLDQLGKGGMGVVYTAFDEELGRKVAVKLLHDRGALGNTRRNRRFLREAQAMAKLSHPNVVTIYEVGLHEGKVYLAMEYVRGVTLKHWMRSKLRPWEEVLNVCCAAGEGLSAAHESGLVHRDFKPENVLLGRDGRVRVLDFGLARQVDTSAALAREEVEVSIAPDLPQDFLADEITVPGSIVGTPAYMAPEQHLGDEADARSDQFSFCVAMWEALYGQRPFRGKTLADIGEEDGKTLLSGLL